MIIGEGGFGVVGGGGIEGDGEVVEGDAGFAGLGSETERGGGVGGAGGGGEAGGGITGRIVEFGNDAASAEAGGIEVGVDGDGLILEIGRLSGDS
jgi:hypothetical protein